MTERRPALDKLPDWPRLMARSIAAAYCGVSANNIEKVFGVEPVRLNARRVLYDRRDLDEAIEQIKGKGHHSSKLRERINGLAADEIR